MKALVMKDLRAYMIFYIPIMIVMILYTYLNIRVGSVDGIIGLLLIFMPSVAGIIIFGGDSELLPLIASLPTSRKAMVRSKYLSALCVGVVLISFTYGIIGYLSVGYPGASHALKDLLSPQGFVFAFLPMMIIVSVCYPLLFKYGFKMGVRVVLGFFVFTYGMGMVVAERLIMSRLEVRGRGVFNSFMALFDYWEGYINSTLLYGGTGIVLVLLLVGSYRLSNYWFLGKDLE